METYQILFTLACALAAGLIMSRLAKLLDLPAVTAYLVAGVLIGPFCLGRLGIDGLGFTSLHAVESFGVISKVALGFIAFTMGNEFRLPALKKVGKQATFVAIFQALCATVLVDAVLIGLHFAFPHVVTVPVALILGAIATATAPAATLMVINQYKAKGPVTEILMPVVALDDAVGLIIFSVSFGIAKAFVPGGEANIISILVNPLLEIVISLALGALMGFLFTWIERFFKSRSKRLAVSVTFVFLTVAITLLPKIHLGTSGVEIGFSSLLTCMMLGTVFCNICDFSEELMDRLDRWTAPLFVLFFVISGAELELNVLTDPWIVFIGLVYILFRSAGKYFGAMASSKIVKCEPMVQKYLGITLLPQAGVALGMCEIVADSGIEGGSTIRNITLMAVLIYELFGPMFTKWALTKAGEIIPHAKTDARANVQRANKIEHHRRLFRERKEKKAQNKENKN